ALIELGMQLGSERDLPRLLRSFCHAARSIIGARYAIAGISDNDGRSLRYCVTSGMDPETARVLGRWDFGQTGIARVLAENRCVRLSNPGGDPAALGFSAVHPPIHTWLGAPIVSPDRVYGWLALSDRIGATAFSDEDESLARTL